MPPITKFLTAALLASAIGVAACGGDEALSKDEFVKQANAACTKYDEKEKEIGEPGSVEEIPEYADKLGNEFDTLKSELDELEPPEELADDYDKLLATADDARSTLDDFKKAAEENDEAKIQQIGEEAERKDKESDALATKLGLTACAND